MIHARTDYNRIQDPKDEPVFLLRAQDQVAAEVVRIWVVLHLARGGDETIAVLANRQAELMEHWPKHKPADL